MAWLLLSLMTSTVLAQQPDVAPIMLRELTDIPGKEVLMLKHGHDVLYLCAE
jgi:hypothetical protein